MDWFSVYVEARASEAQVTVTVVDAAADILMDLLAACDGVVSAGAESWDATVSVQADCVSKAAAVGAALIESRATDAGLPRWPTVRIEAVRQDVLDAELNRSTLPDLVSGPEAAEILRISAQRLHELAAGNARFPAPVYELRAGKLWLRSAIVAFGERWERKPGRPRKIAATG
jgi:hypothetical protein